MLDKLHPGSSLQVSHDQQQQNGSTAWPPAHPPSLMLFSFRKECRYTAQWLSVTARPTPPGQRGLEQAFGRSSL